jgi:hypothetical protein
MLKKLSLAALVAMGSMSVASASTDLSEAIKGVTIGGYLRYRYTEANNATLKYAGTNLNTISGQNSTTNEYKAILNVNVKASDTMTVHGKFAFVDKFQSQNVSGTQTKETPKTFNVREAYLKYKKDGLCVKAGLQNVATPLTDHDDDVANGLLATYTMSGITAAAAYFNEYGSAAKGEALSNNVGALAVIADIKPAKLQAWYYNVSDTGDSNKDGNKAYFLEAAGSIDMLTLKAQYAHKSYNDDKKSQSQFGLAAVAKVANVNATLAYLKFGKDGNNVAEGIANADGIIAAGDVLGDVIQKNTNLKAVLTGRNDNTPLLADGSAVAMVLKTKVGKFTPGVQYVRATTNPVIDSTNGDRNKATVSEYDLDLAYAYNKKLTFSGYLARVIVNVTGVDNTAATSQARFEAKYSF